MVYGGIRGTWGTGRSIWHMVLYGFAMNPDVRFITACPFVQLDNGDLSFSNLRHKKDSTRHFDML